MTAVEEHRGRRCLALSGGVGGAKLALGLAHALQQTELVVAANTADDFEHLGLHVSPDLDTVMYTLAGISNRTTGWGLEGESWNVLEALGEIGAETWFRVGDRDLATHLLRTRQLAEGRTLSEVTTDLCRRLGVETRIVPMTDDSVRTLVRTDEGSLDFQHYFVREQCRPTVCGFDFVGVERAATSPGLASTLEDAALTSIVICPSNPFVSVDPILAVGEVATRMRASKAPIVAVSPIVGGEAIRGPAAKMMKELGLGCSAVEVARYYRERDLLDGFVVDEIDSSQAAEIEHLGVRAVVTNTVMRSLQDRIDLAHTVLVLAADLYG